MDKYEYTVKADKIKQLMGRRDYATAAKIASGIDWSRVQDVRMLMMVAEAYEKNGQYEEAKEVLLTAYDLVPIGKGMLYKLTEICLKQKRIGEAENYYDAYSKAAPNDTGRFALRYEIACARNESIERRIDILEQFQRQDMDERLFYELARLYHKAGRGRDCVMMCDRIILWFGEGEYVDAARELKNRYSGSVAEVRRKEEEAIENRRRRIEEMEAQIEELDSAAESAAAPAEEEEPLPEPEIPTFEIPDEYFDDAPAEEYQGIWEDPSIEGMTVGQLLGDEPEGAEFDDPDGEYIDGGPDGDEYVEGRFDEEVFTEEDFGDEEGYYDEEYDEYYGEDDLQELPPEEYEEDGEFRETPEATEIDLSEFVQAGSARGEGPDVDLFPWVSFEDSEGNDVGRMIWESLEKAERDQAYRPDPDETPEPGYESFRMEAAPAEEPAASAEEFSRSLEAALTEEVAAFDDAPAEEAAAEEYIAEEIPAAEILQETVSEEIPAAEVPAAPEMPSEPMVFASPETEIGGAVLPAVRGTLDPSLKARLYSHRFFDEQGFALPEDELPSDLDDTKKIELPWTYEEQTKKLDELKDIRFGGDAFARMNLSPDRELVDPDRFQGDGSDYVDLTAVREETEAKRAEDVREADELAEQGRPEHELVCILTEVSDPADAIPRAMEMIHDAHVSMGTQEVQTAKVTGSKLNSRGMKACLERLSGRDLIILEAGDLSDELLAELVEEAAAPGEDAIVILSDTPVRLRELVARSPELARTGIYEDESGQAALPFAEVILSAPTPEPAPEPAYEPAAAPGAEYVPAEEYEPEAENEYIPIAEYAPVEEYGPEAEQAPEPALTYDFDLEPDDGAPAEEPAAVPDADTYESILGDDYRPPRGEMSLDEQMAMAFGGAGEPEEPADQMVNTANLSGALAAELARLLDEPEAIPEEPAPAETPVYEEPDAPAAWSGGTKEIEKLSAADLRPAGETELPETDEYGYEEFDDYDDYDDYDELDYEDGEDEDSSFGAIRGFTRYVEEYAESLDCVMDETAGLAVYACAEELLGEGRTLTVDTARELVENAMEQAERTSLRSVFAKKYDKQGRLILREQHFHVG